LNQIDLNIYSYTDSGTSNAVSILDKIFNYNGYVAFYTGIDSHFKTGQTIYFSSISGNTNTIDNFYELNNLDEYPYILNAQGYEVIFIDNKLNFVVIDRLYSTLPQNLDMTLNKHFASIIKIENINIYNGNFNSVFCKNGNISGATIEQIILLNGEVRYSNFISKYYKNYKSLNSYLNDRSVINKITKNNQSFGYNFIYNNYLNNNIITLYYNNIDNGNFNFCNFIGLNDNTNYINNGYFENCNFQNYVINNGYFKNCIIDSTCIWNYGTWEDNTENGYTNFGLNVWNDGVWINGNQQNTVFYNGMINNGVFHDNQIYNIIINNGNFYDNNIYNCYINNGIFSIVYSITGSTITNGFFTGGTFNFNNINGGYIYNTTITGTIINSGYIYNTTISGSTINGGNIYNSILNYSDMYGGSIYNTINNNGNLYNGNFDFSVGKNIIVYNGNYNNSVFSGGTFNNGNFISSTWEYGIFNNGYVRDSNFKNVEWKNGVFDSGNFLNNNYIQNWSAGTFNNGNIYPYLTDSNNNQLNGISQLIFSLNYYILSGNNYYISGNNLSNLSNLVGGVSMAYFSRNDYMPYQSMDHTYILIEYDTDIINDRTINVNYHDHTYFLNLKKDYPLKLIISGTTTSFYLKVSSVTFDQNSTTATIIFYPNNNLSHYGYYWVQYPITNENFLGYTGDDYHGYFTYTTISNSGKYKSNFFEPYVIINDISNITIDIISGNTVTIFKSNTLDKYFKQQYLQPNYNGVASTNTDFCLTSIYYNTSTFNWYDGYFSNGLFGGKWYGGYFINGIWQGINKITGNSIQPEFSNVNYYKV
jgi:hypothetical protein